MVFPGELAQIGGQSPSSPPASGICVCWDIVAKELFLPFCEVRPEFSSIFLRDDKASVAKGWAVAETGVGGVDEGPSASYFINVCE